MTRRSTISWPPPAEAGVRLGSAAARDLPAPGLLDGRRHGQYTVSFLLNGGGPRSTAQSACTCPRSARYVPGSTALSGGPGIDRRADADSPENELIWQIAGVELDTSYELTFRAKPGLSLGTEAATAKIDATASVERSTPPTRGHADHRARRAGERRARDRAGGPERHALPRLHLSGSDRDYFQVQAAAGEQLTIHLSHLNVDDDLVIYGPTIAPLRTPHPGAEAPAAGEVPFELGQRTQSITPEALTDVPQDALGQPPSTSPTTAASPTKRWLSSHPKVGRTRSRSRASTATSATTRGCCASRSRPRFRCRPRVPTRRAPAEA